MSQHDGARPPVGPAHAALGKMLRSLRERRNLQLRDLSQLASPSHLSEVERGIVTPSQDLVQSLAGFLRGDVVELRKLYASVVREQRTKKAERERVRKGEGEQSASIEEFDEPTIEIVDSNGQVVAVDVVDVDRTAVDIRGPFTIEALEERCVINETGYIESVRFARTLRIADDSFQVFRYSLEEDPRVALRHIRFGVQGPVRVERVLRLARTHYIFEIAPLSAVGAGDVLSFRFSLATDGDAYEEIGFVGKQQMVETRSALLSVEFKPVRPKRVWWFELPYPMLATPFGPPPYPGESHLLPELPTGVYEKEFFSKEMGKIVGIAWEL